MENLSAYEYLGDTVISAHSRKTFSIVSVKVFLLKETLNRLLLTLHESVSEPVAKKRYPSYCMRFSALLSYA